MTSKLTVLIAAGALGLAVAGCGTAKAPGIVPIPSAGATSDSATASTATTATTTASTTAAVTTPASGPLSREPTIAAGKGSPPKKLVVKDLVKGTGATVTSANDTITVNYVGALYNGKVFDASWKRKETFTTPLTGVIPGWQKGLVGQKVGSRVQLTIPPALAYGAKGSPPTIPGDSTLIFDIDLLKVAPAG